jgi:N-acetylmuramoyl-L-alanine amidase
MAYLTNGEQERLVQTEAYQSSLAQALYNAVVGFRAYLDSERTP